MKQAKRTRREDDELYWLRYDVTTEICDWPQYAGLRINQVGEIAEKIARAVLRQRRRAVA